VRKAKDETRHRGMMLSRDQGGWENGQSLNYHNGERRYGTGKACFAVEVDRDFAPLSQGATVFSHYAGVEKTLDFSELNGV